MANEQNACSLASARSLATCPTLHWRRLGTVVEEPGKRAPWKDPIHRSTFYVRPIDSSRCSDGGPQSASANPG
jgi:hypothetical protein